MSDKFFQRIIHISLSQTNESPRSENNLFLFMFSITEHAFASCHQRRYGARGSRKLNPPQGWLSSVIR